MMQPSEMMKNRQKRKSTYFVDRKLCPRIKEYLEATRVSANADDIVNYLQTSFNEYARKKRHVLMLSVQKALQNQLASYLPDKTQLLEENHLRKRQKKSNDEDESTSGSSSEEEILVEYKDSNALNNSMQDLYRKTVPSPKPCLKKEEENWAVDKTPSLDVHVNTAETPKQVNNEVNEEKKTVEEQKQTPATKNKDENSDLSKTPSKLKSSRKSTAAKEKVKKFASSVSTVTFKDIGGYETSIEAVSKLLLHLKHPEVFTRLGIQPPRGFLLQGAPGCGKSLLAHAIAGELQLPFFSIAATEVVSGISGESEQKIRELFTEATLNAPSIVFIDEIDSITPKREVAGKESERRVVTQILSCMDELMKIDSHVLVIGATSRADSIDPALRRAGRFDREIAMGIPTASTRKKILQVICRDMRLEEGFDFDAVANQTPGFVGADLKALAREAAMCAVESVFKSQLVAKTLFTETHETKPESNTESGSCDWLRDQPPLGEEQLSTLFLTTQHFQEALGHVQPSAKREGFATVPDVTWKDIGALEDVREELTMAIMAPVRNPEAFECLGLQTPPGILLAGPPGCGKTLLAKAIANEAGINFISVKGPELLNMYVGESEKAVRQVFQRARNSSPCVIFFDEIDALCPRRSQTGDSSASSRVVNQLLTEMDGVQTRKQVFIMGATNRPDILDAAILRPGRLDKLLFVGLPNAEDREKILDTITKNGKKPEFADDITVKQLAEDVRTEGFSGADLNAVVREASVAALKEFMKADRKKITEQSTGQKETTEQSTDHKETTKQSTDQKEHPSDNMETEDSADRSGNILLHCKHFDVAFEKVKPSVSGTDRVWYDDMKERNVRRK